MLQLIDGNLCFILCGFTYCHNCDLSCIGLNLIVKDEGIEIESLKFIFRFGNGPTT